MKSVDYYHSVPRDVAENLKFRERLLAKSKGDRAFQSDMRKACSDDGLFFINAFFWIYNPDAPAIEPFITFDFQNEYISALWEAFGKHDVAADKSRKQGATWCTIAAMLVRWCWRPLYKFLLISRNEKMASDCSDPDSLLWKWDALYDHLPIWLRPKCSMVVASGTRTNEVNGSVASATATTEFSGVGGRATAALIDEHAKMRLDVQKQILTSLQYTTNCRIQVSTPNGAVGAFHETMTKRKEGDSLRKFHLHWSKNPMHNEGLYTSDGGLLRIIDEAYWQKRGLDYRFITDGKIRSPWYDFQCERAILSREIAEELDIDYLGSGGSFFDPNMVQRIMREHVRDPDARGELVDGEFIHNDNGRLWTWCDISSGRPAKGRQYVIGCDISLGTGASNSCASICDVESGEKVAEFSTADTRPADFAEVVVGLGKWFGDQEFVTVIWEANGGPGRNFGDVLHREIGWKRVYWDGNDSKGRKRRFPGWWSQREPKKALLFAYGDALASNRIINHSAAAMQECGEYVNAPGGGIEHVREREIDDPSGAGDNHGDRVIADALCVRIIRSDASKTPQQVKTPTGCFQHRFEAVERQRRVQEAQTLDWARIESTW